MLVSLDTNVVDEISRNSAVADAISAGLRRRFRFKPAFYITPTTAFEMAVGPDWRERLEALARIDTLFMPWSTMELKHREVKLGNAYRWVNESYWPPVRELMKKPDPDSWEEQLDIYRASKKATQEIIDGVESHVAVKKDRLEELGTSASFEEYVESRWRHAMGLIVSGMPGRPDVEKLWEQGKSVRAMTCLMLASVFRRLKPGSRGTAQGAYSDVDLVAEGAYGELILTKDGQLVACGEEMRSLVPTPAIQLLKGVLELGS